MNDQDLYFKYKCFKGLKERGLSHKQEYIDRLEYEIGVILGMGFPGYFLIVQDFIKWAKKQSILVGPGRGSAAGSLVAYCLSITELDPIRWGLIFERFLNPDRISMPDIDVDFDKDHRYKVIEYVTEKYGTDRVAHIGTFGTHKSKGAIKAVARTLGYDYAVGNNLSKLLLEAISGKDQPIATSIEKVPELDEYVKANGREAEIIGWAQRIEGMVTNVGIHASGVVIANNSILSRIPLFKSKGTITTQFEMNTIEEVGLIKFDFLGIDALSKMSKCMELIKERHGIDIDIDSIDQEDELVFEKLQSGDNVGIFQLEGSAGIRDLLVRIGPKSIEDLTLLVAAYRPGPLGSDELQHYLEVRAGNAEPRFLIPELEPILGVTDGLLIYQEQIMKIATDLCGYKMSVADELRKAVGKKKKELMDKHEAIFKKGWADNGYPVKEGDLLWDQIVAFAAYGFNKSHAAAYAFITYQTAWLKAHYPVEYMAAIMICQSGKHDDIIRCITECKRLEIEVLPPDINLSQEGFSIDEDNKIRFGLGPIKNLGYDPCKIIVSDRNKYGKFISLRNLLQRVDGGVLNVKKINSLIESGALDSFGHSRRALLTQVQHIWDYNELRKNYSKRMVTYEKRMEACQQRLVDIENGILSDKGKKLKPLKEPEKPEQPFWPQIEELDEMPDHEIQKLEHELLGFFVTSHPLDKYINLPLLRNTTPIKDIEDLKDKSKVTVGAVISSIKEITTKKDKRKMAFVTIEDLTGSIETMVFANTYEKCKDKLVPCTPLKIQGTVDVSETDKGKVSKILIHQIDVLRVADMSGTELIDIKIPLENADNAAALLDQYKGSRHTVKVTFCSKDGTQFRSRERFKIGDYKEALLRKLKELFKK